MRVFFWNTRGMGKKSRVGLLKDFMFRQKVDIVGVQETIKQNFSDAELLSLGAPFSGIGSLLGGIQEEFWSVSETISWRWKIGVWGILCGG